MACIRNEHYQPRVRTFKKTVLEANCCGRFGYGAHTCPGRHFAIRLVKIIFTNLILKYDIEWDGETKQKPPPMCIEGQFIPNLTHKITLRKRVIEREAAP